MAILARRRKQIDEAESGVHNNVPAPAIERTPASPVSRPSLAPMSWVCRRHVPAKELAKGEAAGADSRRQSCPPDPHFSSGETSPTAKAPPQDAPASPPSPPPSSTSSSPRPSSRRHMLSSVFGGKVYGEGPKVPSAPATPTSARMAAAKSPPGAAAAGAAAAPPPSPPAAAARPRHPPPPPPAAVLELAAAYGGGDEVLSEGAYARTCAACAAALAAAAARGAHADCLAILRAAGALHMGDGTSVRRGLRVEAGGAVAAAAAAAAAAALRGTALWVGMLGVAAGVEHAVPSAKGSQSPQSHHCAAALDDADHSPQSHHCAAAAFDDADHSPQSHHCAAAALDDADHVLAACAAAELAAMIGDLALPAATQRAFLGAARAAHGGGGGSARVPAEPAAPPLPAAELRALLDALCSDRGGGGGSGAVSPAATGDSCPNGTGGSGSAAAAAGAGCLPGGSRGCGAELSRLLRGGVALELVMQTAGIGECPWELPRPAHARAPSAPSDTHTCLCGEELQGANGWTLLGSSGGGGAALLPRVVCERCFRQLTVPQWRAPPPGADGVPLASILVPPITVGAAVAPNWLIAPAANQP
ncbi:hypothetical protein JKP88DRAFT_272444 [Tribonema minus]|uniref:Uncharacterized protein n=1 Tax=Tribonema minus TaxID=303371 RepID=A0A835ZHH0_9STRA|nr:hypothetical protein JKP88DRAFT_272444 [Tribonema minus]